MSDHEEDTLRRNFGHLRRMLRQLDSEGGRAALWSFCANMRRHAPERYDREWIAYLSTARIDWPDPFQEVTSPEQLAALRAVLPMVNVSVSLRHKLSPEEREQVDTIIAQEHVTGLTLHDHNFTDEELVAMLESPSRRSLRALDLRLERLKERDPCLEALVNASHLTSLREVRLKSSSLLMYAPSLLNAPWMETVELLELNLSSVGRPSVYDAIEVLTSSPHLREVEDLELTTWPSHAHGGFYFERRPEGAAGDRLSVRTYFPDELLEDRLALLGGLALKTLAMKSASLSARTLRAVARSVIGDELEVLDLSQNWQAGGGVAALLQEARCVSNLRELDLSQIILTREDVLAIASAPLSRLERLSLESCELDDDALTLILANEHLSELADLNLYGNDLTDEGIMSLANSPRLAKLRELNLWGNRGVHAAGVGALLESELSSEELRSQLLDDFSHLFTSQ